jgi:glycosyltransferase involved in cell wall biosynthesis
MNNIQIKESDEMLNSKNKIARELETDGVSVIICCYNSALKLPQTILHLANQNFQKQWEIIIVDNGSTDKTKEIATRECEKHNLSNFILVDEVNPGLNYARLKGVETAKYEYIIFCDDDNWLSSNYLSIAYECIASDATFGAVGGECIAVKEDNIAFPEWFEKNKNHYAVGKQANSSGDITERGYLWGAGLVTKKTVFNKCFNSEFPPLLTDRVGKLLSSGGDSEFCVRAILAEYKLFYNEQLVLHHFISSERLTSEYHKKLQEGFNSAGVLLEKYFKAVHVKSSSKKQILIGTIKSIVKIFLSPAISRWNVNEEKDRLFLFTNIDLGIDPKIKIIQKFKKKHANFPS